MRATRRATTVALAAVMWCSTIGMVAAQESRPQLPALPGLQASPPLPPPPADLSPGIPVPLKMPEPVSRPAGPPGPPSSSMKSLPFGAPAQTVPTVPPAAGPAR